MGVKIYNARGILHNIRVGKLIKHVAPPPSVEIIPPTWISGGDLGSYMFDEELNIILEYDDPSNIVNGFELVGHLPAGVYLNTNGGTIYGYIEDTESTTYNFQVVLKTVHNDSILQSFSISSIITSSEIVWGTGSNLGEYGVGSSINHTIEAYVVESS